MILSNTEELSAIRIIKWLLGIVAIITFSNFMYRGYTTNDDLEYFLAFHKEHSIWKYSYEYAKSNGRFYFMFMQPLFNVIIPNVLPIQVSQLLNLTIVLLTIVTISVIVNKVFNSLIAQYLFVLITLVFINIKSANNAIVSYPFYFTSSFFLFSCSILSYLNYLDNKKNKWIFISLLTYGSALLFYENYILYISLYVFFAIYYTDSETTFLKFLIVRKELSLYVGIIILYLIIYSVFKSFIAVSGYDGVTVSGDFNLLIIFKTLINVTRGAYPLFNYFTGLSLYNNFSMSDTGHIQSILNPIINIQISWLVKALLVSVIAYILFSLLEAERLSVKRENSKLNYWSVTVLVFLIYIPQSLIALTVKYQQYALMGMSSYVTTYFSTFPVYILITIFFVFLYQKVSSRFFRKIYQSICIAFLALCSVLTDYANYHTSIDLKNIHKHFEAINKLIQSEVLQGIPENSIIIAPQLFNNRSDISYYNCCNYEWDSYFKTMLNKNIKVIKDDSLITALSNIYYLGYSKNLRSNDQFFSFSKLNQYVDNQIEYSADTLTLFAFSPSKQFSVHISKSNSIQDLHTDSLSLGEQKIVSSQSYFDINYSYQNKTDFFKPITIVGEDLDPKSVVLYINSFDVMHQIAL